MKTLVIFIISLVIFAAITADAQTYRRSTYEDNNYRNSDYNNNNDMNTAYREGYREGVRQGYRECQECNRQSQNNYNGNYYSGNGIDTPNTNRGWVPINNNQSQQVQYGTTNMISGVVNTAAAVAGVYFQYKGNRELSGINDSLDKMSGSRIFNRRTIFGR